MGHKQAIDLNILMGKSEHGQNWTNANRKQWATDDLDAVMKKLPAKADLLINAIDAEDENGFIDTCTKAGLTNEQAQRVWDATMGSIDPQSSKPCW